MRWGMVLLFSVIGFFVLSKSMSAYNDSKALKDPLTELIKQEKAKPGLFTILLFDMKKEGFISNTYKQRYRIVADRNGSVSSRDTKWYPVKSSYFWRNENNLGMELAAQDSTGKVWKVVTPPGYTNFLGNPRYGYWTNGGPMITESTRPP